MMIDKLKSYKSRFDELTERLADADLIANNKEWQKCVKDRNAIEPMAEMYVKLFNCKNNIDEAKKAIKVEKDAELISLFEEDLKLNLVNMDVLNEEAKLLLLPKDENDEKNVIIEIRAGAGGDEAGIFGKDLMKMYTRYAERKKWKVEVMDITETSVEGIKDTTFMIHGNGAFRNLKYESGVHRVQRVPETETQGRVHTSTATVAVLPELEEVDVEILDKDLKIDTYRSSGAGGQHVNKTDSAVRFTHLPTGIVVTCQDERSQIKNRERAMNILRSKLYDFYQEQKDKQYAQDRKIQIGTGDRSEKIRTYNYPQSRITDHRINYTTHNLDTFMDGDIQDIIDELTMADQKAKLEKQIENDTK